MRKTCVSFQSLYRESFGNRSSEALIVSMDGLFGGILHTSNDAMI